MQKKVHVLVRLQEVMQEKLKTAPYSYPIQFLPWYLINGLECTVQNILISLNTLFELNMKSNKQVKNQQNLLLKKGKAIITVRLHLVTKVFEDDNFRRQVLENKDYISVTKGVHKEKLQLAKVFVTCKNFILFQKNHPNVNIEFSKFSA